jgi:hypothetical protein
MNSYLNRLRAEIDDLETAITEHKLPANWPSGKSTVTHNIIHCGMKEQLAELKRELSQISQGR